MQKDVSGIFGKVVLEHQECMKKYTMGTGGGPKVESSVRPLLPLKYLLLGTIMYLLYSKYGSKTKNHFPPQLLELSKMGTNIVYPYLE
jgi:hypothetical protein